MLHNVKKCHCPTYDKTRIQFYRATILERIRAIEIDNIMAGDNATENMSVLNKDSVDVSKVPINVLLELAPYLNPHS